MQKILPGLLLLAHFASAQDEKNPQAMLPFWKGKEMYNESVLMVSRDGKPAEGRLLFPVKKIRSVRNAGQTIEYKEGVDWEFKHGVLRLLPGSKAIFMTEAELYPDSTVQSFPKKGGGRVRFAEGAFFHEKQLAVSYSHGKHVWKGVVPAFQGEKLPHSTELLKKKQALHLLLYGDSISAGANASSTTGAEPYLPVFGALVAKEWEKQYGAPVKFTNTAVGGMESNWGLKHVKERVIDHHPDLVIIAYGMNDGTHKLSAGKFKSNVKGMIDQIRADNAKAEIILVSTMLPNPESLFVGTQEEFKPVLDELTGPGIVLVDMSEVHRELLKYKSYQDMTGNNINHPNDFLVRWYAQEIAGVLLPE